MKIEIMRSYSSFGKFNMEHYSDETFGRFIKELLTDTADDAGDNYKELRLRIFVEEQEE